MTRRPAPKQIAAYSHRAPGPPPGEPAGNLFAGPRDYFASMKRDSRHSLLAGPFATHGEALAIVDRARAEAISVDSWAVFDSFGTCSLPAGSGRLGCLNARLGVTIVAGARTTAT